MARAPNISPILQLLSQRAQINRQQALRKEAERKRQQQARLTLALAAGGAAAGGAGLLGAGTGAAAGAQFGAAGASLLGPQPNVPAAVQLGVGGFQTRQGNLQRQRQQTALDEFSTAINPPGVRPNPEVPGGQVVRPPPNRQAAAGAAARLGDLGTAATLAFGGQQQDQTPFEVRLPAREPGAQPTTTTVFGKAALREVLRQNPGARARTLSGSFSETPGADPAEVASNTFNLWSQQNPDAPLSQGFRTLRAMGVNTAPLSRSAPAVKAHQENRRALQAQRFEPALNFARRVVNDPDAPPQEKLAVLRSQSEGEVMNLASTEQAKEHAELMRRTAKDAQEAAEKRLKDRFGSSFKANEFSTLRNLAPKIANQAASPEEERDYALAYSDLSRQTEITRPDGSKEIIPGLNLEQLGFPRPLRLQFGGEGQPTEAAERERADVTAPARTEEEPPAPLSTSERETVQFRQEQKQMLDIMEQHLNRTGKLRGIVSEIGAFFGTDSESIAFNTAKKRMRLALQASIKGTPSEKDQQLVDDLLPTLLDAPNVARAKIILARQALESADQAALDYFEKNNISIPEALRAAEEGREVVEVQTIEEAKQLDPGTVFVAPDGRIRVRE